MKGRVVSSQFARMAIPISVLVALVACSREAAAPVVPLGPSAGVESRGVQVTAYSCQGNQSQVPVAECSALVDLYQQTSGPTWAIRDGWLQSATPCSWYGVQCNSSNSVVAIVLSRNLMIGAIPPSLGSLTNLTYINFSQNLLTGPIPPALGSLTNLVGLYLNINQLTGPIPAALGSLASLQILELWFNQLTGPIPPSLGSLGKLRVMRFHANGLTGPIPPALGSLTNLTYLNFESNSLTGPIPSTLGSLTKLNYLYLNNNQLTGPIPPALGSLTNLGFLYLGNNRLTGRVPLPVARLGGRIEPFGTCFLQGNAGLRMGGGPAYRAADDDHDGYICSLPLSS